MNTSTFMVIRWIFTLVENAWVFEKQKKETVNGALTLLHTYTLVNNYMYKHVQDWRYHRYRIQQTIKQCNWANRTSRLVHRRTTGHVRGAAGRCVGSSGPYVKYVRYDTPWWEVFGNCTRGWTRNRGPLLFPLMGVVIALINHLSEHFTYRNKLLVDVGHRDSETEDLLYVYRPLIQVFMGRGHFSFTSIC